MSIFRYSQRLFARRTDASLLPTPPPRWRTEIVSCTWRGPYACEPSAQGSRELIGHVEAVHASASACGWSYHPASVSPSLSLPTAVHACSVTSTDPCFASVLQGALKTTCNHSVHLSPHVGCRDMRGECDPPSIAWYAARWLPTRMCD